MKPLIVFYSHSGNNEKLAMLLKGRMACEVHKIRELKKRRNTSILLDFIFKRSTKLINYEININEYDTVIFVGPIWASKLATPMKVFIENEKSNIKKYFFITLCNGVEGQREKLVNELSSIVKHNADEVKELWINRLLPVEKQNMIKYTFNFRVSDEDLEKFSNDIESFIGLINENDVIL